MFTLSSVIRMHIDIFGTKMPPLKAIYRAQIALFSIGESAGIQKFTRTIGVPDMDIFVGKLFCVSGSFYKPEQLFDHTAPEHALCCQQRKDA